MFLVIYAWKLNFHFKMKSTQNIEIVYMIKVKKSESEKKQDRKDRKLAKYQAFFFATMPTQVVTQHKYSYSLFRVLNVFF